VGIGVSSQVLKRQGCDVDRLPPRSAEVKNEWSYTSAPPTRFHGVERDNFTSEAERCSKSSRKSGDVLLNSLAIHQKQCCH
jgi:hypothetical protein